MRREGDFNVIYSFVVGLLYSRINIHTIYLPIALIYTWVEKAEWFWKTTFVKTRYWKGSVHGVILNLIYA